MKVRHDRSILTTDNTTKFNMSHVMGKAKNEILSECKSVVGELFTPPDTYEMRMAPIDVPGTPVVIATDGEYGHIETPCDGCRTRNDGGVCHWILGAPKIT
jgi:hypothetical protein